MPPNAETGSPANAACHASVAFSLVAIPQALLCLMIAAVTPFSLLNSAMRLIAASQSSMLL